MAPLQWLKGRLRESAVPMATLRTLMPKITKFPEKTPRKDILVYNPVKGTGFCGMEDLLRR